MYKSNFVEFILKYSYYVLGCKIYLVSREILDYLNVIYREIFQSNVFLGHGERKTSRTD